MKNWFHKFAINSLFISYFFSWWIVSKTYYSLYQLSYTILQGVILLQTRHTVLLNFAPDKSKNLIGIVMIIFHKVRNIHTAIIMILFFQFSWNTLTFYTSRVRVCVPHYFCLFAAGLANCPLFYNTFTCSSPVSYWHAKFPVSKSLYAAALLRVIPSGQAPYSTFSFYHHRHHKHQ